MGVPRGQTATDLPACPRISFSAKLTKRFSGKTVIINERLLLQGKFYNSKIFKLRLGHHGRKNGRFSSKSCDTPPLTETPSPTLLPPAMSNTSKSRTSLPLRLNVPQNFRASLSQELVSILYAALRKHFSEKMPYSTYSALVKTMTLMTLSAFSCFKEKNESSSLRGSRCQTRK